MNRVSPFDDISGVSASDPLSLSNHTEIIYSVFVAGKPVLATTAAKDMELLSNEEVIHVLELPFTTKAERTCFDILLTWVNGSGSIAHDMKLN